MNGEPAARVLGNPRPRPPGGCAHQDLRAAAGRKGNPDFSIFGMGPDRARTEEMIQLGFNRVIFGLPSADADTVLPLLDRYAEIGHAVNS